MLEEGIYDNIVVKTENDEWEKLDQGNSKSFLASLILHSKQARHWLVNLSYVLQKSDDNLRDHLLTTSISSKDCSM